MENDLLHGEDKSHYKRWLAVRMMLYLQCVGDGDCDKKLESIFSPENNNSFESEVFQYVYNNSLSNRSFWLRLKAGFIGTDRPIDAITKNKMKDEDILPIQYQTIRIERIHDCINKIMWSSPCNQRPKWEQYGDFGECVSLRTLNLCYPNSSFTRSGKIPWRDCLTIAVTPDYLVMAGEGDGDLNIDEIFSNDGCRRAPLLLGIGECKTTLIKPNKVADYRLLALAIVENSFHKKKNDVDLLREILSFKSQDTQLLIGKNDRRRKKVFINDNVRMLSEKISKNCSDSTECLYVKGDNTRIDFDSSTIKKVIDINLWTHKIGRQLVSELLTVAPFVNADVVYAYLVLTNVTEKNDGSYEHEDNLNLRFKVNKSSLMKLRNEVLLAMLRKMIKAFTKRNLYE